ncbi:MAG TPA: hypothetical protein VGD36_12595 [Xanthobacteraceae bacterium]
MATHLTAAAPRILVSRHPFESLLRFVRVCGEVWSEAHAEMLAARRRHPFIDW